MKSNNFSIELKRDKEIERGTVYFKGAHFANLWKEVYVERYKNKWMFNRDGLALGMECPILGPYNDLESILTDLEGWYKVRGQNEN